jgi:hypothetical protein
MLAEIVLSDKIEREIKELPDNVNLEPLKDLKAEDKLAAIKVFKAMLPKEAKEQKPAQKPVGATIPGKSTVGEKPKHDVIANSARILAEFNEKKK